MSRDRVGPHARAVRDPEALLATWTRWCLERRTDAEPEAEFSSTWIWWDTPEGRLHREGTQLVERRSPGQPSRLELHRGETRRTLDEATVDTWIARGRPIVPLLWTSSYRRIWFAPRGGQLEWQEWTRLDGTTARTVALIDPDSELSDWWSAKSTRASLGRKTNSPSWPDHALVALRTWLHGDRTDPGLDLTAGIRLAHELAAEDSPLAPLLLERVHARLQDTLAGWSGACAPSHPAWARSLRSALDLRVRSRPSILQALSTSVARDLVAAEGTEDPRGRATRLRVLQSGLRGAREHLDVKTGKLRRRLGELAFAWEGRARASAADAWLAAIGQDDGAPLDADARMEIGARRRRLDEGVEELEARIHSAANRLPRGRIRRLVRALPSASAEEPPAPAAAVARKEEV